MSAAPLPADFMLRNYRVRKVISRGGFGVTYLAEDLDAAAASKPWGRPDRLVAIKEYLPLQGALRLDSAAVEPSDDSRETTEMFSWGFDKFADEARLLGRVSSKRHPTHLNLPVPNFAQVGPFFEENNTAYIVMEYIAGGSLRTQLDRVPLLDEARLKPLLAQLLDALSLVHEDGVWHRDIKPQNILLRVPAGVEEPPHTLEERARNRAMPSLIDRPDVCPVLIDFGAARTRPSHEGASAVSIVGTEGYAPPEQFEGRQIGPWSDIYAVSALAYRAITGRTPTSSQQRQTAFLRTGFDPLEPAQRAARASGSPNFLMALDWGLWIESELRPQSLAEWRPVLLDGVTPSPVVAEQFLIEALVERGPEDAPVSKPEPGSTELPIVDEAVGDLSLDADDVARVMDEAAKENLDRPTGDLKPGKVEENSLKQESLPDPKPVPKPRWPALIAAGAVAAVVIGGFLAFKPHSPPPDGDKGIKDSPAPVVADTLATTVLADETLTTGEWVTADFSKALGGGPARWVSLEADAPVRVKADGKVYLLDGEGVRIPDLAGGSVEVRPVNPSKGPTHFQVRAGYVANLGG